MAVVSRAGVGTINDLTTKVLFADRHHQPLGVVPFDWQGKVANYEYGKPVRAVPLMQTLYVGLRVMLTHNKDKSRNFVNGMSATVLDYHEASGMLRVRTEVGNVLEIHPYTDEAYRETWVDGRMQKEKIGRVTCYPMVVGGTRRRSISSKGRSCRTSRYG